jgi:hypothetical protein
MFLCCCLIMFSPLNILYFVFCMFVLIRPIFVSIVCEVLSTLRAGDAQGKSYDTVFCVVRPRAHAAPQAPWYKI